MACSSAASAWETARAPARRGLNSPTAAGRRSARAARAPAPTGGRRTAPDSRHRRDRSRPRAASGYGYPSRRRTRCGGPSAAPDAPPGNRQRRPAARPPGLPARRARHSGRGEETSLRAASLGRAVSGAAVTDRLLGFNAEGPIWWRPAGTPGPFVARA